MTEQKADISPHLLYFHEKYKLPASQVVKDLKREYVDKGIHVVQADNFLKSLDL